MRELVGRYLAVGIAGSLGAIARVIVAQWFGKLNWRFPIGTLVINISGSLFLGWFLTHVDERGISPTARLAIGAGFVGAYTTFSTYMYESNQLASKGAEVEALVNVIGSVILGILAVRVGIYLARWV
ncbi:MAG: fluoride efflux transporter CrcB [Planctomycetota bacterium]|nr:fluoride efflux transporter CrcB [Planctomycetota bacterium]